MTLKKYVKVVETRRKVQSSKDDDIVKMQSYTDLAYQQHQGTRCQLEGFLSWTVHTKEPSILLLLFLLLLLK